MIQKSQGQGNSKHNTFKSKVIRKPILETSGSKSSEMFNIRKSGIRLNITLRKGSILIKGLE